MQNMLTSKVDIDLEKRIMPETLSSTMALGTTSMWYGLPANKDVLSMQTTGL